MPVPAPERRSGWCRASRAGSAVVVAGLVLSAGACGGGSGRAAGTADIGTGGSPSTSVPTNEVVAAPAKVQVLAASSLANVLPDLVAGFRTGSPNVTVETSTGASTALVEQVRAGADADVVLTADLATADAARRVGVNTSETTAPQPFATSTMVVAVPARNPGEVRTLDDLANPELLVGLCAAQVPCGKYARQLLKDAGVSASVDTEEPDARSLMAKIASGDLDAGLVYRTDALAAGPAVRTVEVPAAAKVPVTYFAVGRTRGAAAQFVAYLRGPGRKVLTAAGFGLP